jgi:hypothetical protein
VVGVSIVLEVLLGIFATMWIIEHGFVWIGVVLEA